MSLDCNSTGSESEVSEAAVLAFLKRPESYPDSTARVEVKRTHLSWVFLTDHHVFKLKKRVVDELVDFRRSPSRRANCETELRLNRRLAPAVYLEVVPITLRPDGHLALGGDGEPIDWLVKMARLDQELFLDRAIHRGSVDRAALAQVGRLLNGFYGTAPAVDVDPDRYLAQFYRRIAEARRVIATLGLPEFQYPANAAAGAMLDFLRDHGGVLIQRLRPGTIREVHGDLRPEHIHLGMPVAVIDCLEFAPPLRQLDPVEELAYLAMECERLDAGWIGDVMFAACAPALAGAPPPRLVAFYKASRALQRSRLTLRHSTVPGDRSPHHWLAQSAGYLAASCEYVAQLG